MAGSSLPIQSPSASRRRLHSGATVSQQDLTAAITKLGVPRRPEPPAPPASTSTKATTTAAAGATLPERAANQHRTSPVWSVPKVEFVEEALADRSPHLSPWPWNARRPSSLLRLKPNPVRIRAERPQDLAGATLAASCEDNQHVLSPRLAHPKSMGGPESVLGSRRERQLPLGARTGSDAKSLSNHLTDGLNGQPEIRPDSVNDAVLIREQAKEQMLHLDRPVPHVARLAPRTHDRLARSFCEPLKHTQKVLSRLASRHHCRSVRSTSPERRPQPQLRPPDSRTSTALTTTGWDPGHCRFDRDRSTTVARDRLASTFRVPIKSAGRDATVEAAGRHGETIRRAVRCAPASAVVQLVNLRQ